MDVKIGVVYSARELSIEVDGPADEVASALETALRDGLPVLWLTDRNGRRVGIATDKVAYVEIAEEESKRIGFGPG